MCEQRNRQDISTMSEPFKSLGYERQIDERVDDDGESPTSPLTSSASSTDPIGVSLQPLSSTQTPGILQQPHLQQPQTQYPQYAPVIAQPVGPIGTMQPNYLDRIPVAVPLDPNRQLGRWSDDICDCFDNIHSCCWACWVPPYRWALTLTRAQIMKYSNAAFFYGITWIFTVIFFLILVFVSWLGLVCLVGFGLLVALGTVNRGRLRRKYGIDVQAGCLVDCVTHTCCCCCAISQEARHVDRTLQLIAPSPHQFRV